MPYIAHRIMFTMPPLVKSAIREKVNPRLKGGVKNFVDDIGQHSAERLQDGYLTRATIKRIMPTRRDWIVDRWIEECIRCGILIRLPSGVLQIVDFAKRNITRAVHAQSYGRKGRTYDYYELVETGTFPNDFGNLSRSKCSKVGMPAPQGQNRPQTNNQEQKDYMSGAKAPSRTDSHPAAPAARVPEMPEEVRVETEQAANAPGASRNRQPEATPQEQPWASRMTPEQIRKLMPKSVADALLNGTDGPAEQDPSPRLKQPDTGKQNLPPHPLFDPSAPNEHDIRKAVRDLMPDALQEEAVDATWREIRRCGISRSELAYAVKHGKTKHGALRQAFAVMRNQRLRQRNAGWEPRGAVPDVRNIPLCGRQQGAIAQWRAALSKMQQHPHADAGTRDKAQREPQPGPVSSGGFS